MMVYVYISMIVLVYIDKRRPLLCIFLLSPFSYCLFYCDSATLLHSASETALQAIAYALHFTATSLLHFACLAFPWEQLLTAHHEHANLYPA